MTMREFKKYVNDAINGLETIVRAYQKAHKDYGADYIKRVAKLEELKDISKGYKLMKLNKKDFAIWKTENEKRLEKINYYVSLLDEPYKFGYRGKRHKLVLCRGNTVIVSRLKDMNFYINYLYDKYVKGKTTYESNVL